MTIGRFLIKNDFRIFLRNLFAQSIMPGLTCVGFAVALALDVEMNPFSCFEVKFTGMDLEDGLTP
jgi:hypothetical protein